jgi:hypothetical protein
VNVASSPLSTALTSGAVADDGDCSTQEGAACAQESARAGRQWSAKLGSNQRLPERNLLNTGIPSTPPKQATSTHPGRLPLQSWSAAAPWRQGR